MTYIAKPGPCQYICTVIVFQGLGKALRFLREKRGKSQKHVARQAGITPPMLSAYENGRTHPELETLDKILHLGLVATVAELGDALDVVNDRHRIKPAQAASRALGGGESDAPPRPSGPDAVLGPIAPVLEEGYELILQGLLKVSRAVYESVVRDAQPPPKR